MAARKMKLQVCEPDHEWKDEGTEFPSLKAARQYLDDLTNQPNFQWRVGLTISFRTNTAAGVFLRRVVPVVVCEACLDAHRAGK